MASSSATRGTIAGSDFALLDERAHRLEGRAAAFSAPPRLGRLGALVVGPSSLTPLMASSTLRDHASTSSTRRFTSSTRPSCMSSASSSSARSRRFSNVSRFGGDLDGDPDKPIASLASPSHSRAARHARVRRRREFEPEPLVVDEQLAWVVSAPSSRQISVASSARSPHSFADSTRSSRSANSLTAMMNFVGVANQALGVLQRGGRRGGAAAGELFALEAHLRLLHPLCASDAAAEARRRSQRRGIACASAHRALHVVQRVERPGRRLLEQRAPRARATPRRSPRWREGVREDFLIEIRDVILVHRGFGRGSPPPRPFLDLEPFPEADACAWPPPPPGRAPR